MAGSFLGQGLTDLAGIFDNGGGGRPAMGQPTVPLPEFAMPQYGWGTQYGLDSATGMPILPGSDYGPPSPISPSDKFNVKYTMEETDFGNPVQVAGNFLGNLTHGVGTAITGLTGLLGMTVHDALKTAADFVPGHQNIQDDGYKLYDEFFVPMLGIGSAKSTLLEDWKYRYGFTDSGWDLGKVGRGLYEQPFSFLNDALMFGGATGSAAKALAKFGETRFAVGQVGQAAVDAAKLASAEAAGTSAASIFMTDAQKAAMAAGTRPTWLTRAMDYAALTPDEKFIGALKPKTFEVPIGPLNETFSRPLSSNPVARGIRLSIYKSPIVATTFDKMDQALKAMTGGFGYDAYVERLSGGSFGTGIENPGLMEAFANLGNNAVPARSLFMKMQRMVEDTSEAIPQSFKYNKVFKPTFDKLYENRLFNNIRSTIAAGGMLKRKVFESSIVSIRDNAYKGMDAVFGEGVFDEPTRNKMLLDTAQAMLDDEAIIASRGINSAQPYAGLEPAPVEWNNVTDAPPPAVAFDDANIYNFDRVIKPTTEALSTGARKGLEKFAPNRVVYEETLQLPSGPRRVVVGIVPTLDDSIKAIRDVEAALGGKTEWIIDTLRDGATNEGRLVRTFIAGIRTADGSLVEFAPATRHSALAAQAASSASRLLFKLIDDLDGYAGEGAILDSQYARMETLSAELAELKAGLSTATGEELIGLQKKIQVREGTLSDLRDEFGRNLDTMNALQRNIGDGYAFIRTQLNEGIDNMLKYGPDYNPMWKWRDEMSVAWWTQVLEKEMGAVASHAPALDFSVHMRRIYSVRRINKVYKVMNEFAHDLKRFLDGDFVDDIARMPANARVALAQALGVSEGVAQAIISGDRAAISQVFTYTNGTVGAPSQAAALAARISAFMHMNQLPTAAIEDVVSRVLTGIKEGPANNSIAAIRSNIDSIDIAVAEPGQVVKANAPGISIMDSGATLDGTPLWDAQGNLNTSVAAQAVKRYMERKIGHILESGDIPGFRWRDLHDEWHVQQGMPTPIYFPHMPKPSAGSMHMSIGSSLSALHPRDTWLKRWDGELLKRGIYDKNFLEVWAHRATQIIRHQEIAKLFEEAKRFSRKVSPRELDLWEAGWMQGEKLWNPHLVDLNFRLTNQARQTILDMVDEGMDIDAAATQVIKEIMPDAFTSSLRATTGEIYAVPSHIAQKITYASRLNMPWFVRMFYDGPMQVWRTSVLAFSPRWIVNNTLGNTIFQLIKNPRALLETIKMYDAEYRAMWEHIGGGAFPEGVDRGLFFEQGNIIERGKYGYGEAAAPRVAEGMRKFMNFKPVSVLSKKAEWMRELNGVVEDAARRGVFAAEYKGLVKQNMMRYGGQWVDNAQVMERIMKNGLDADMAQKALEGVNKVLGDYTNLNPVERQIIRRFVFPFYAFWKHSVKFLLSTPFENPFKVAIMRQMDALQQEMWGEDMPDWFRGGVFVGTLGQSDPLWLRTKNMNPLEGLTPSPTGVVGSMSPFLRALFENQTGLNTYTGKRFSTADTFETPTGQIYKYVTDDNGKLLGVRLLSPDEKLTPSWWDSFLQMWPQYNLIQNGLIDYMQGEAGAKYTGTGDTIMEGGKPKYPTPMGAAWASYFGFPITTFDPNDYLYRQYRGYWRSALPMAQSQLQEQTGMPTQMGVQMP